MFSVRVELGPRSYDVLVGVGVRRRLGEVLPAGADRAAIVTQNEVGVEVDPGIEHRIFTIVDGESSKSLATVELLCRGFAEWGLNRGDVVVGVGGGVVTDVAGFAAAVYHRGVPVVHVPTTLLAQVDAAIGGKTGVNLPEGKNLVGAYWQPAAVLCDTEVLAHLPPREYRSGLGEVAKYSLLAGSDGDLVRLPEEEMVARCVEIKAAIVAADEREAGHRALLNYGHTLGHAVEAAYLSRGATRGGSTSAGPGGASGLRHGECVAMGLVFAARLARRLGRIGDDSVARHLELVRHCDLPTELPSDLEAKELMTLMTRDKKGIEGLTFVLDGPAGVEVVKNIRPADVEATLAEMGSQ